ncbi:hypothetical protein EJ110_NYTH56413 [Nymphaea thermarum]|nr:hypothetical protein EJ110_NYTH56413 [Nymphaea thermarum]
MADSSSSTVITDETDVGISRIENFLIQVTTIRLTKKNYLQWSAAITMGIAGRGRIAYVNGKKVEPIATSAAWDTWFLEDNQSRRMRSIGVFRRDLAVRVFRAAASGSAPPPRDLHHRHLGFRATTLGSMPLPRDPCCCLGFRAIT